MNTNASLVVVGSGIKFISHLTTEAKTYITASDIVLYLINEPAMQEWIQLNSKNCESLDKVYTQYPLRSQCYQAIAEYILTILRKNLHVCVVIYGHPTVLAQPTLDAVKQARKEGYYAKALPGISSEDCIYADLLIDPSSCGSQLFEATDFILRKRKIDSSSHLFLFQIGYLGTLKHKEPENKNKIMKVLLEYLMQFYNKKHGIFLYEAAQYPTFEPRIEQLALGSLPSADISPLTTLYIPPAHKSDNDKRILSAFKINPKDLK